MNGSTLMIAVLYDRATSWLDCFPSPTRSEHHIIEAMQEITKPTDKIKLFYCGSASELAAGARYFKWRRPTSTPGIPQTNGLAKRCVRKVKDGGRSGIAQSGFTGACWWHRAAKHFFFYQNIAIVDGGSSYNKRHKQGHLPSRKFAFGSLVGFLPQPGTKREGFESNTMRGVFV